MQLLIATKGLQGSGKSTWAKQHVLDNFPKVKRVNKDDIRAMIHADKWTASTERDVVRTRDALINSWLSVGHSVICDDTNLNPVHMTRLEDLAKQHGVKFYIKDFTHVSVEQCILNDLKRANSVGESVIRQTYQKFLAPEPNWIAGWDESKLYTVICDLDGTIAWNDGHRGFYDYTKVGADKVHFPVWHIVQTLIDAGQHITFLSGRDDSCEVGTYEWLVQHVGPSIMLGIERWKLLMRKTGDKRRDDAVKLEILDNDILPQYNVLYAFDDRRQVIDGWRSRGITVLDVADGRF